MMELLKHSISVFALVASLIGVPFSQGAGPTAEQLAQKYATNSISILIVPGHDNRSSGTSYKGVREADVNLKIAEHLATYLRSDPKFKVQVTREGDGSYAPWFLAYLEERGADILAWRRARYSAAKQLLSSGTLTKDQGVTHNTADSNTVTYLYAANHYANENGVDLVLHLHVNDVPRKNRATPGTPTGYAIYIPEEQYPGSATARTIAHHLASALGFVSSTSTLPLETEGIVEDQDLIAIGAWGTRNGPSLLIEYGYIYEPTFFDPSISPFATREFAYQTFRGLKKFFGGVEPESGVTSLLPGDFSAEVSRGSRGPRVLALQAALKKEGFYAACPITGVFGPCTEGSVARLVAAGGVDARTYLSSRYSK